MPKLKSRLRCGRPQFDPRPEPPGRGRVCCASSIQRDANQRRPMTEKFAARAFSSHVARVLILAIASVLTPAILSTEAGAQILGFASTSQGGPSSESTTLAPALADEGDGSGFVVPERLRRTVVA